jgi:hypothetical protein
LVSVEAPSELLYEGSYEKRGNFIKNWKTRWFAFGNKKGKRMPELTSQNPYIYMRDICKHISISSVLAKCIHVM